MLDFEIVQLKQKHLAQSDNWIPQDVSKILLKKPNTTLQHTDDPLSWAGVINDEVLCIASVSLNKDHVGFLECIVKPNMSNQGIGTQMIEYVLRQRAVDALIHLHTLVAQDNIGAQKILEKQGFTRIGFGADNQIEFARHKYQSSNNLHL